jgi:hypothetical protein
MAKARRVYKIYGVGKMVGYFPAEADAEDCINYSIAG